MNSIERASRERVKQIADDRRKLSRFLPDEGRFWERLKREKAQRELRERGKRV